MVGSTRHASPDRFRRHLELQFVPDSLLKKDLEERTRLEQFRDQLEQYIGPMQGDNPTGVVGIFPEDGSKHSRSMSPSFPDDPFQISTSDNFAFA
ncbi:hypothetical protein RAD15_23610 [Bradyrhizobium sp. 14AA]